MLNQEEVGSNQDRQGTDRGVRPPRDPRVAATSQGEPDPSPDGRQQAAGKREEPRT